MVLVTHNVDLARSIPRVVTMRDGSVERDEVVETHNAYGATPPSS
jgi:ABC-type lipoprotein export system ATPase subunit